MASTRAATYSAIGCVEDARGRWSPRCRTRPVRGTAAGPRPRSRCAPSAAADRRRARRAAPRAEVKSHTNSTSAYGSRSASVARRRTRRGPARSAARGGAAGRRRGRGGWGASDIRRKPFRTGATSRGRTRATGRTSDMHGLTTLAPEPTVVNTDCARSVPPSVSVRPVPAMDVSFLGGPQPQRGVGVVAPFDFALDRELWRWVPDDVSLHLTRTPYVPVEVSLDLARLVSEHETLRDAVRALSASAPEVVAYACTSGSFVGGVAGERAMCEAMTRAGDVPVADHVRRAARRTRRAGRAPYRPGHALHGVGHPVPGGVPGGGGRHGHGPRLPRA